MARSPQDDPLYGDMQHQWSYLAADPSANVNLNHMHFNSLPANENLPPNQYINTNLYSTNTVFNPKHFNGNVLPPQGNNNNTDNSSTSSHFTNVPNNLNSVNNDPNLLDVGNGQFVRVFYDEETQTRFALPVNKQYELFSQQSNLLDNQQVNPNYFLNTDYASQPNSINAFPNYQQQHQFPLQPENADCNKLANPPLHNNFYNVWSSNIGTYSPYEQNYSLNTAVKNDVPTNINDINKPQEGVKSLNKQPPVQPMKKNEASPLARNTKQRIVAEVKPMRPSYSDIAAKNAKNPPSVDLENLSKISRNNAESKQSRVTQKTEKSHNSSIPKTISEDKTKNNNMKSNLMSESSSKSDGLDSNGPTHDVKSQIFIKKSKERTEKINRKWSSLDDLPNDVNDKNNFESDVHNAEFVCTKGEAKSAKKGHAKKNDVKSKPKPDIEQTYVNDVGNDSDSKSSAQFVYQETTQESSKIKKKPKERGHSRGTSSTLKSGQEKKRVSQVKPKKNRRSGYVGVLQQYLENWSGISLNILIWLLHLVSDVLHMSLHLLFDLLAFIFTQSYVSSQTLWRSTKEWLSTVTENKYLQYIDMKFGHTQFGFWRKIKWFKKVKNDETDGLPQTQKSSVNIPLPATGEEAMKRLLACKGKDPYSILGVSVKCTDDDIKRYYRRQAFLVHPDKNAQPGAEEAFKILQHAFELIGEPERREEYDRRTLESRHAEVAWSELSHLLQQLHTKMERAANTIRCTSCGRRHKRVITDRPCYAARYCAECKLRHSAKEGDIWAESSMWGLVMIYYGCMDGAVYQISEWASCQKKQLKQLRPDTHAVHYRIVFGSKAGPEPPNTAHAPGTHGGDSTEPNLEDFLNKFYNKTSHNPHSAAAADTNSDGKKRRSRKK